MIRDVSLLSKNHYDVLVIGGGILGACVFWEAGLRGLSAALVEQNDFASGASANSLKIIHGGLRYLQSADFRRMRMSARERTTLMRIAPHLVHPLPVLVPTYGHGMHGSEALGLAMRINDLVSFDRNRSVDPEKCIPNGRILSREECLKTLPGLPEEGLTGAALFYDAQVYNSERLVLAFLKSCAQMGGDLANYARVIEFVRRDDRVVGVKICDQLTGHCFDIQAKMVVNCAGAWLPELRQLLPDAEGHGPDRFARGTNIITRSLFGGAAVGLTSGEAGNRLLFVAPWRGQSIIGTHYSPHEGPPDRLDSDRADIDTLLTQVNQAYPPAELTPADVRFVHRGLLPVSGSGRPGETMALSKHPRVIDHRQEGIEGVLSVIPVKYTTSRQVASGVVDRIFKIWEREPAQSVSATIPLRGGEMQSFGEFLRSELAANVNGISALSLSALIRNYGSEYSGVLSYLPSRPWEAGERGEQKAILNAQICHAVYKEMAIKLSDVVFRRTELASAGEPDNEILMFCAQAMGKVLNWEDRRIRYEIEDVRKQFAWKR
ncbi:MAG: glycerol-3-phosphate dehydrogenase/oxidase [Chloroflexi bacterium]|nr:glycerol-3-phosphate dehydrogenase/oxidase [Chloroflexota bacterium]